MVLRYSLTGSESPWVTDAASNGSREEELVERNASVALKTAVTILATQPQRVGRAWGWGWAWKGQAMRSLQYHPTPGTPGLTRTHHRFIG